MWRGWVKGALILERKEGGSVISGERTLYDIRRYEIIEKKKETTVIPRRYHICLEERVRMMARKTSV